MKSSDKNQFFFKKIVQRDNFIDQKYPTNCHIQLDDDRLLVTNCRVSTEDYLLIIDGTTDSGHEVKILVRTTL